jgi:hypothetical protein
MIVGGFGNRGADQNFSGTVEISDIQIIETPPFYLTPSGANVSCSPQTTETFTVVNNNGITGISGYTWNIGSNSGWLYNNGSGWVTAPATINTSGNTLTLSTSGQTSGFSSITATVSFPGGTFTTNAFTPTYVAPSQPAIQGPSTVCSQATYTIPGLPYDVSCTWSDPAPANGNGTFQLTAGSNNTATLRYLNYFQSTVTLTATYTSGCIATSTLPVFGTSPNVSSIEWPGLINQGPCFNTENIYNQSLSYGAPNSIYDYCPALTNISTSSAMHFEVLYGTPAQFVDNENNVFSLQLNGGPVTVGGYVYKGGGCPEASMTFVPLAGSLGPNSIPAKLAEDTLKYDVTPNPAVSNLSIILRQSVSGKVTAQGLNNLIRSVKIYDVTGRVRMTTTYGEGISFAQLDVSRLETGIYFAEISDGKSREVKKFFVAR